MKKIKLTAMILLLSIVLVGCNHEAKKDIEQGKSEFENKEYDDALMYFKQAIDKGSKEEDVITMAEIIEVYNKSMKEMESNNLEEAKKTIDSINPDYINYSIKEDVDNLKEKIDVKLKEEEQEIDDMISEVDKLIANKDYDDVKILINEIEKNKLSDSQKKYINELIKKIDSEIEKIENAKKESLNEAKKKNQLITEDEAIAKLANYLEEENPGIQEHLRFHDPYESEISGKKGYVIQADLDGPDMVTTIGWFLVENSTGHIYTTIVGEDPIELVSK